MASLRRLLVLVLLGTARAAAGDACNEDGSSAAYTETITTQQGVEKRTITSTGCPNHESYCTGKPGPAPTCDEEGLKGSGTEAVEQDLSVDIPANPILKSSYEPGELDCSMGAIAYALNGIGFYSGAVGYDADGNCPQLDVADPEAEWISFDCCTGHSDYDAAYHYHFPPSCLLAQANKAAPISDGHSAQVGWAEDGFPIYGPLGPGGVEIRNCGTSGAHSTYCQDECGGYEGELPGVDNYKYRYYITGKVGDLNTLPSTPMPDSEELYYPYTIRCYRGCTMSSGISDFKSCIDGVGVTDGFTSAHTATALDGYTTPVAVQCWDDKTYADYGFTEAVITPAADPTPRPTPAPVPAPTPRPTLAGALAGGTESSAEASGGSGGGGGGDDVMVAGAAAAGAALLLAAAAAFVFYRRSSKGSSTKQRARGGGDLEEGDDRSAIAFARHEETSRVTQRGMMLASALLSVGSSLPLVGRLCEAAQSCLGSAEEFSEKADDVLVAAKRVVDVLNVVQMMARNADKLAEGRELVEQAMRELVDLVVEFDGAVRKFGKKGWLQRAFKMQSHVKSLGRLDRRIVAQLQTFRDIYRLSVDHLMMERTYRIEASVGQLVAERVRATGESEAQAAASLSADPAAVARVAADGRVAAAELSSELQEFRLEVKEGLGNLDKKMQQMLAGLHGDKAELAGIAKAVNAAAARDAELMKAVEAGAARDEQILAAVEAGAQRDAGLRQQIRGLGDSLRRKTKKESARQYKDAQLERYEVQVDDVSEAPIATGGFGSVHTAWYAEEEVCLKKISIAGLTHARRAKVVRSFKMELSIMCHLRSPRIVSVLGAVTTDGRWLGLVMEYCAGGSLRAALDDESGVVTGALQRTWSADVAFGMAFLYAQGVEHRDLKALNVLLTSDLRGKVTDFGLSRCDELKTALTTQATAAAGGAAGTPAFMAPELLEDNIFTEKSDVYSYAIVLWEIWDRGLPWHGLQPVQITRKVVDKRQRPPVPAGMPAELRELMLRAWAPDPADRPDFAEISSRLKAFSPRTRAAARPPASSAQNSTRSLANPRSWLGGAS